MSTLIEKWETTVGHNGERLEWAVCEEGGGDIVAEIEDHPNAEHRARLMAEAPAMLAVLQEFLADQETMNEPYRNEAICERARSILARIDGREGGLSDWVVLYREADDLYPANPPLVFHCSAENEDHAQEQCESAYPGCHIAWTYQGSDWQGAFDDYFCDEGRA